MSVKYICLLVVYLYILLSSYIICFHHHHHHHQYCHLPVHYSCSRLHHTSVLPRMISSIHPSYSSRNRGRNDVIRTVSKSMSISMSVLEPSSMMDVISTVIQQLPSISNVMFYDVPSSLSSLSSSSSSLSVVDNSIILSSSSSSAAAINIDMGKSHNSDECYILNCHDHQYHYGNHHH